MTQHRTDKELKNIALDICKGRIFCDWQIEKDEDVHLIFQAIGFMTEAQNLELQSRDIGCIYEYMTAAYSYDKETGIPVFISMNILTVEEAIKVGEYFQEYKNILDTEKEVEI
jgi:hypothetical protein